MATPRLRLKLTREVETVIDELLEDNERKREQNLRKRMLKKKDILEELHRRGLTLAIPRFVIVLRAERTG